MFRDAVVGGECPYLDVQRPVFDLRCALLDDERNAIGAVFGRLSEVDAKQVQLAMELLVATLNGQRFQAFLMAGQGTLGGKRTVAPKSSKGPERCVTA